MILLLLIQTLLPGGEASDWYTLLQTGHSWKCSADHLISGNRGGVLSGGLPLAAIGDIPDELPWPEAEVLDPLESGIWGGGRWNTSFQDGQFQDSLSLSRIGLIQNTLDRSRYLFQLNRPLPWASSANLGMFRDDTVSLNSAVFNRRAFHLRLSEWGRDSGHGWGFWSGYTRGPGYIRAGFSRLYEDDRRPEILGGLKTGIGPFDLEFGGGGASVDSAWEYRAAAGLRLPIGAFTALVAADRQMDENGYWGGLGWTTGGVLFSAIHSSPAGGSSFQSISIRHHLFTLIGRFSHRPAVSADMNARWGFLRGSAAACWFFSEDSLEINCNGLLGKDWYRGRFEAGPRFRGSMNSSGEWQGTLDAVAGFVLLPFSFGVGYEDITGGEEASWSFGITWAFTDLPPERPEGEGGSGERD